VTGAAELSPPAAAYLQGLDYSSQVSGGGFVLGRTDDVPEPVVEAADALLG